MKRLKHSKKMAMQSSNLSCVNTPTRQAKAGLTLIELAIALFVIALVFAGVYGMSSQVTRVMSLARGETRAVHAAQAEIERLRTTSWDAITALGSSYAVTEAQNAAIGDLPHGVASVTISPYPETATNASIRRITVSVQWQDALGKVQTNELSTLIAQHGLNP
jgi:prepilin-type N-terminal cleavage/methylation domain-containing protein